MELTLETIKKTLKGAAAWVMHHTDLKRTVTTHPDISDKDFDDALKHMETEGVVEQRGSIVAMQAEDRDSTKS